MKTAHSLAVILTLLLAACTSSGPSGEGALYLQNAAPLRANSWLELPLGSIRPEGWLREMLLRQKSGATRQMDELNPQVMGVRNGWLGGDGDQWERGPYWLDGLVPLAYILQDDELIGKVKSRVEWVIQSQTPDGYFGPSTEYPPGSGLQKNNSRDWWPIMVMLKVLKQYYSATGDERVIQLFTGYFRYQLRNLPETPLGHWTFWGEYRVCDNLMAVYWLYNITKEPFLLELADLIYSQAFDVTGAFLPGDHLSRMGSLHCVNLTQGIKMPLIYCQHHPEHKYQDANRRAVEYGPLVYALRVGEKWTRVSNVTDPGTYGDHYFEVLPATPWNYGLLASMVNSPDTSFHVVRRDMADFPWNQENAPIEIRTKGIRIPSWQLYNQMAGPLPWSGIRRLELGENPQDEDITLIPYGCTSLRISEFPVIRSR